jgi:hypothetical protein
LLQPVPQSGHPNGHLQALATPCSQLRQGQIRLGLDPAVQGAVMLGQTGAPVTADLFGLAEASQTMFLPETFDAFTADAKTPANFARASPALTRSYDSLS